VLDVRGAGRETPLSRAAVDGPGPERLEVARRSRCGRDSSMLDEVDGGAEPSRDRAGPPRLVRRVRDSGVTIVLIEHVHEGDHVGVCKRALVLNFGRTLVERDQRG